MTENAEIFSTRNSVINSLQIDNRYNFNNGRGIILEDIKDIRTAQDTISKLKLVIEINTFITKSLELREVQKGILDQVKRLLNCDTSSVLLVDKEINRLKFAYLSKDEEGQSLMDTSLSMGEGIAGTVWGNGTPVVINDAQNDPRFSNKADKKSNKQTQSLIAVPLTYKGEIIGVIEAINKKDGAFNSFDLEMLQYISTQSAIAIKNAELYDMANKDGMTKLYINKYFKERLQEEFSRSFRYNRSLSVILLDIDHFKNFNNTYGHLAGDLVIKEVSKVIATSSRSIDIPCRYGGEEFSIILPETSRRDAMTVIERIRQKVEKMSIKYNGTSLNLTISGGVATIPELSPGSAEEFIDMADKALYYSKKSGRNRVTFFNTDNS